MLRQDVPGGQAHSVTDAADMAHVETLGDPRIGSRGAVADRHRKREFARGAFGEFGPSCSRFWFSCLTLISQIKSNFLSLFNFGIQVIVIVEIANDNMSLVIISWVRLVEEFWSVNDGSVWIMMSDCLSIGSVDW